MKRITGALALCLTTAALTTGTAGAHEAPTAATAMAVNPACSTLSQKLRQATTKKQRRRLKAKLRAEACPGY